MNDIKSYNSPDTDPMLYHDHEEYEDAPKLEQNQDDDYIDEM